MRNLGLLLLVVSMLLGGVAVWGLKRVGGARAAPVVPAASGVVQLVVASRPIGFGEKIELANIRLQAWPQGAAPAGAFRSAADLVAGAPRIALGPIAANEPILPQRVSGPGGRASLASLLGPGMRASTIRVDDVMGVAGFVLPGDLVDVLLTRPEGADRANMRTDILLQAVRVLAVDQQADQGRNNPLVAKSATVEVTPAEAEKLTLGGQIGVLSLSLRSLADGPGERQGLAGVRAGDLAHTASQPGHRTPTRLAAAPDERAHIQIFRGTAAASVAVVSE